MKIHEAIVNHTHAGQKLLEADLSEAVAGDEMGYEPPSPGGGIDGKAMQEEMKAQLKATQEHIDQRMDQTNKAVEALQAEIISVKEQVQRLCDALIK